jgi:hypothetical protein
MAVRIESLDMYAQPMVLSHAPSELTQRRLRRLGEGIGKVAYASDHWVVKRERSESEIIALIVIWKLLRRFERLLPARLGNQLLQRPAKQIRLLRVLAQPFVLAVPRGLWFMTHVGDVWTRHQSRDRRGATLAAEHLLGTSLIPKRVTFPPIRVRVGGWPGWLEVHEATERVEATFDQRLDELAKAGRFDELEQWLDRLLDLRQSGWRRGLFSVDAHLKNFGVTGDRVVLLDTGGLTDTWSEVEERLAFEEQLPEPHIRLGLGKLLAGRLDIAARFNARWKEVVCPAGVRRHWPSQ